MVRIVAILMTLWFFPMDAAPSSLPVEEEAVPQSSTEEAVPQYLYKVLSKKDWDASQSQPMLKLPSSDRKFVHLSEKSQLQGILEKYFSNQTAAVILKLDPLKLKGKLIKEASLGDKDEFYHLYGEIPQDAVLDAKVIKIKKAPQAPQRVRDQELFLRG